MAYWKNQNPFEYSIFFRMRRASSLQISEYLVGTMPALSAFKSDLNFQMTAEGYWLVSRMGANPVFVEAQGLVPEIHSF